MGGLSKLLFLFSVKARRRPVLEPTHHPPPFRSTPSILFSWVSENGRSRKKGQGQKEDQGGREGVPS